MCLPEKLFTTTYLIYVGMHMDIWNTFCTSYDHYYHDGRIIFCVILIGIAHDAPVQGLLIKQD